MLPSAWRTIAKRELVHSFLGEIDERPVTVDRQNPFGKPPEHGCGEARAGADFQHPVAWLQFHRVENLGGEIDAFEDRTAFDRQRA
jgi:hypothetical protein